MDVEFYKYVLTYTSTDSFTYWIPIVLPFETMEPDVAVLEVELLELIERTSGKFFYHGIELDKSDFVNVYNGDLELPTIYTLDGWFDLNKPRVEE